jgi:hypothetical protein
LQNFEFNLYLVMDGKENQPQNISDVPNSAQEQTDVLEILKSLSSNDQKIIFDANKYQNEEDIKKISTSPMIEYLPIRERNKEEP